MKITKIDYIHLTLLVIISTFLRLVFYKKYPLDGDGFYFLKLIRDKSFGNEFMTNFGYFLGEQNIRIFLSIIVILSIILFYFLMRLYISRKYSFITTLFLGLSPIIFTNTYFGMVDKNIPSIFMIILILFITKKFQDNLKIQIPLIIISLAIFYYIWVGAILFILFYGLYYLIIFKNVKMKLLIVLFLIITFFKYGLGILKYFTISPDKNTISELLSIWNIRPYTEYIIIIIAYILLILILRHRKKIFLKLFTHETLFFFLTLIGMIFVFRISLYAMISIYLMFGIMLEYFKINDKIKTYTSYVILFLIIITSFNIYNVNLLYNPVIEEASLYMNEQNTTCVIGLWSKGSIYEYFTNKTALFKNSIGDYKSFIDYFKYGKENNCSMIWSDSDLKALEYMLIKDNDENYLLPNYIESLPNKNFTSNEYNITYYVVLK